MRDHTEHLQLTLTMTLKPNSNPDPDPNLDGEDLLCDHTEHLQLNSVELIEARPDTRSRQP